jgi:integrase
MAKIRIKRDGIEYKESMTFDRKAAANAWIIKREDELNQPGAIQATQKPAGTLADAIDKYIETSLKAIGRTKAQVLEAIKAYPIAGMGCKAIMSTHIVELADALLEGGRQPQTVGNYLSHLQSVFSIAPAAWGFELDEEEYKKALKALKRLGKVSASEKRDRRPSLEEINAIMELYQQRQEQRGEDMAPMTHIVAFSLFSTRRQEETTRLFWADLDPIGRRVLVRDMKNPGEKKGNDVWCDLPGPAWDIIQAMPRVSDRIFPFNGPSLSASFTRICKLLHIEDLHFHDLRHEGISRLFEMKTDIPHVAKVSGHRSWNSLKRYAHINQTGDKYADWPWLKVVTQPATAKPRQPSKRNPLRQELPKAA